VPYLVPYLRCSGVREESVTRRTQDFQRLSISTERAAEGMVGLVLVIAEGIGDSKGKEMSFVRLFLIGCHRGFHLCHEVVSETEIIELLSLLPGVKIRRVGSGEAPVGWCSLGTLIRMWNKAGHRV